MQTQTPLPQEYHELTTEQLAQRIAEKKAALGEKLCILGHHYQSDEVIQFADITGDSLKLSQLAAQQQQAQYIVFCGVHFMAESADILSSDRQVVCLPNMAAGCAMADMADATDVAAALDEVRQLADARVIPISYVNSTAAIKAVTAQNDGACCTSSNVRNVFEWAFADASAGGAGADKVFCIPDQHLGRNTAIAMGYTEEECVVYDPAKPNGGLTAADIQQAKFILWKGHCYVHQQFKPEHIEAVREKYPGIQVIVHPECPREVVMLADAAGSTEQIIRAVADAPAGSQWAIGTESNLVNRLAKKYDDRFICVVNQASAICVQMKQIDLPHLAWTLDNLAEGKVVNQVTVDKETAAEARIALQRMIDIRGVTGLTQNK